MVWQHFIKIKVGEFDKAKHIYCKELLGGESKNRTRQLHDRQKDSQNEAF